MAGVAPLETPAASRWAKRLELPALLLALWILAAWYMESTGSLPETHSDWLNWAIWLFFVGETVSLTFLVRDRQRYLQTNWMNLLVIAAGIPIVSGTLPYSLSLRSLRLLLFFNLLVQLSRGARLMLSHNHLGSTLAVSSVIIVFAGYLMAGLDPAIQSPAEGIWWAWVTVTTVGYGDIVPVSTEGRIFGGLLILLGIGLFSMITASFSVFFLSKGEADEQKRQLRLEQHLKVLEEKIDQLLKQNGSSSPPESSQPGAERDD